MCNSDKKEIKMSNLVDQQYLLNEEYKNASNLNARLQFFQRFSTNQIDQYRWLFDHFNLRPSSRILELGCGPGFYGRKIWIVFHWTRPSRYLTFRQDDPRGSHNLRDSSPSFTFQVIDAQAIPLESSRFDAVIANNMLFMCQIGNGRSQISTVF